MEGDEEKRGNEDKSAKTSLISLINLPRELLMVIASFLDLPSYLALSTSSTTLLDVLAPQYQWETILDRTRVKWEMMNPEKCSKRSNHINKISQRYGVWENCFGHMQCPSDETLRLDLGQLTNVLRIVQDPDNSLLLDLLHFICDIIEPPDNDDLTDKYDYEDLDEALIALACPCLRNHVVSPATFALLEQVETAVRGEKSEPLQKILVVRCPIPEGDKKGRAPFNANKGRCEGDNLNVKKLFKESESDYLASRASRQMQQVESTRLKVALTYRDGVARVTLLQSWQRCTVGAKKSATSETLKLEFNCELTRWAYHQWVTPPSMMNNSVRLDFLHLISDIFLISDENEPLVTLASSFVKQVQNSLQKEFRKPCSSLTMEEETEMTLKSANLFTLFSRPILNSFHAEFPF